MKIAIYLDGANQAIDNAMQWHVMYEIASSLTSFCEVEVIDSNKLGSESAKAKLIAQRYDLLITYNKSALELQNTSGENIISMITKPHLCWLVEHPVTFYDQYKNSESSNRHYLFTNISHENFKTAVGLAGGCSALLFGSKKLNSSIKFKSRPIDICIAAQWRGLPYENEFWRNQTGITKEFFESVADYQNIEENKDTFSAYLEVARILNINLRDIRTHLRFMKVLYWHARKHERIKVVQDMVATGLTVALIGGDSWKQVLPNYDNVIFIEPCKHETLLEYYQQSKAVVATNCSNGACERVFDAMAAGAIALTENSFNLDNYISDEPILIKYQQLEAYKINNTIVDCILGQTGAPLAERGHVEFLEKHTWEQRAVSLFSILTELNSQL